MATLLCMAAFISLTKDRSSRWVLSLSFDWILELLYFPGRVAKRVVSGLVRWLLSWRYPSTQAMMGVASAGLGVGVVVALFGQVLIRPAGTLAVPTFLQQQHTGPKIDSFEINRASYAVAEVSDVSTFYSLPRATMTHLQTSGRPSEARPTVVLVGYTHQTRPLLQSALLGEELRLIGDNNGRYTYQVVGMQVYSLAELSQLESNQLETSQYSLFVVVPQTVTNQEFLVVMAE